MNPSQSPLSQPSPSQQRSQQIMQQRHQQLQLQQQQQQHHHQQQPHSSDHPVISPSLGFQNSSQGSREESVGGHLNRRENQQPHYHQQHLNQQPSFHHDFKFSGSGENSNTFISTDNHRYSSSVLNSPSLPSYSGSGNSGVIGPSSQSVGSAHGYSDGFQQQSNATGLESLESLASLSVLSPSLPVPIGGGSMNRSGGSETVARKNSSGYFSPSFQPSPSMPAAFHQQQQQSSFGSLHHQHHMESSTNNSDGQHSASPHSSISQFAMASSISSSLPMPSNFHLYNQPQSINSHHQPQQLDQQSHLFSSYSLHDGSAPSASISASILSSSQASSNNSNTSLLNTFSRETRPRSRSGSPANHSLSPSSRKPRINSLSHHHHPFRNSTSSNQADNLATLSSPSSPSTVTSTATLIGGDNRSGSVVLSPMTPPPLPLSRSSARALSIPPQPRMIPPRADTGAPRKYHGRQLRKVPIPTIDLVSGVRDYVVPPTRRLAHILSEQKRREKINAGFEELKSVIPECAQNTDSKATILRKAVDRILELEQELRKYTVAFEQGDDGNIEDSHRQDIDQKPHTSKDWEE